jgi:hypothetical protein
MGGIFNNAYDSGVTPYKPKIPVESGDKDVILPTVLKVGKEELDYWTNMTCFYDKQWEFNPKFSTVPIGFMHITSVSEITTAQGSEKRVILYESPSSADTAGNGLPADPNVASHPAYRNNLEVIMDNVVVQPKQYQMEVIIPASLIGPYHLQGLSRLAALIDYLQLTDNDIRGLSSVKTGIQYAQTTVNTFQTASDLIDTVMGLSGSSAQMATINKNSIDAMAGAGHVVCFKKWTGYDYSYGIITKLDITKRPSEEGVYRGSITFQETPILNISPKKISKGIDFGAIVSYGAAQTARVLNLALAYPFIQLTGVMEEAGAPGSDTADGGTSYDIFIKS